MSPQLSDAREIACLLDRARDAELQLELRLVDARAEVVRLQRLYQIALSEAAK